MNATNVMERTENYVRENFLYARPDFVLEPDHPLIGKGVLDSMGVMELVAFIADEFGVTIGDEDITEQNLGSLTAIAAYVTKQLESRPLALVQTNAA
jgi:acyl carrier protein